MIDELIKDNPQLRLEADLYWLAFANVAVLPWLKERETKVGLVHIKDMQEQPQKAPRSAMGFYQSSRM